MCNTAHSVNMFLFPVFMLHVYLRFCGHLQSNIQLEGYFLFIFSYIASVMADIDMKMLK